MRQKVKLLINDYAGHPFVTKLSSELAECGFEVIHSYFADDQGPKGNMQSDKVKYVGLSNNNEYSKTNFLSRYLGDIEHGKKLEQLILKERPDVIFSGNTPLNAQEIAIKAADKVKAKFIFWCQDFYFIAAKEILKKKLGLIGSFIGFYFKKLETKLFNRSDHIVVITDDFKEPLSEMGIQMTKVTTIHNWGNLEEIKIFPKKNEWTIQHNISDTKFRVIYTGTMGFKHNPNLILELAIKNPDVEFLVLGTGIGFDSLSENKAENIKLMPLQPLDKFAMVLASADVCIALLEDDAGVFSVPSKVLNYLCAAKPVLMSGPKENLASKILVEKNCGLVSDSNDINSLNDNLQKLKNEKERNIMAQNSRRYAEDNFDIEKIAKKFIGIISN